MDNVCLLEDHGEGKRSSDCALSDAYGRCFCGNGAIMKERMIGYGSCEVFRCRNLDRGTIGIERGQATVYLGTFA